MQVVNMSLRTLAIIYIINLFFYNFTSYYAHICIKFLSSYSSTSLNHEKSPNSSIMLPHPQHVTLVMIKLSISSQFQNIYPVFIMFWSSWREIRACCSPFSDRRDVSLNLYSYVTKSLEKNSPNLLFKIMSKANIWTSLSIIALCYLIVSFWRNIRTRYRLPIHCKCALTLMLYTMPSEG